MCGSSRISLMFRLQVDLRHAASSEAIAGRVGYLRARPAVAAGGADARAATRAAVAGDHLAARRPPVLLPGAGCVRVFPLRAFV